MPPSDNIWFGNVGLNTWAADSSGTTGRVVRTLESGVIYSRPLDPRELPAWAPAASGGERKTVALTGIPASGGRPAFRRLYDLAVDIRPRRGKLKPTDPQLDELDWVVRRLIVVMTKLHEKKKPLGLIHPLNVMWYTTGDKRVLVLPDAGFTADPSGVPDWVADPKELRQRIKAQKIKLTADEGRELDFRGGPIVRGEPEPRGGWYPDPWTSHHKFNPAGDVASVARVFDWIISGQIRTSVPPVAADPGTATAVYTTLAMAVEKGMETEAFQKAVVGSKMTAVSGAFLAPSERQSGRPRVWLGRLLVVGVLGGGAAGGWVYVDSLPAPAPAVAGNPRFPKLKEASSVRPHLDALDKHLLDPPPDQLEPLLAWLDKATTTLEAAGKAAEQQPAETDADRATERECLAALRRAVRKEYDDRLSRYRGLEDGTEFGPAAPTQNNELVLRRARKALELVKRMKTLSPQLPEDETWKPEAWVRGIEEIPEMLGRK